MSVDVNPGMNVGQVLREMGLSKDKFCLAGADGKPLANNHKIGKDLLEGKPTSLTSILDAGHVAV